MSRCVVWRSEPVDVVGNVSQGVDVVGNVSQGVWSGVNLLML